MKPQIYSCIVCLMSVLSHTDSHGGQKHHKILCIQRSWFGNLDFQALTGQLGMWSPEVPTPCRYLSDSLLCPFSPSSSPRAVGARVLQRSFQSSCIWADNAQVCSSKKMGFKTRVVIYPRPFNSSHQARVLHDGPTQCGCVTSTHSPTPT